MVTSASFIFTCIVFEGGKVVLRAILIYYPDMQNSFEEGKLLSKATFSGIFQISIVFDQQFINLDVPLLTNTWNLLSILTHRKKHIQLFQKYIDTLFHTHYEKSIDLSHYWMCLFYSRVTVCVANIPLQWFCISIGNNREFLKKF